MDNTFGINIIPDNDQQRLEALKRYKILDTPPEGAFDNVAKLATEIFKVPISLISLVDKDEVYFKANVGMGRAKSNSRGVSLCSLSVLSPEVTVFESALQEPCLLSNPNVIGNFGLQFYAGAPLTTHDGFLIGTLCIIDKTPREFTHSDSAILKSLAKIVMDEIELRLSSIQELEKQQEVVEELAAINEELTISNESLIEMQSNLIYSNAKLNESEALKDIAIEQAKLGIWYIDAVSGDFIPTNRLKEFFGYLPEEQMSYENAVDQIRPDYRDLVIREVDDAMAKGKFYDLEYPIIEFRSGRLRWVRATGKLNQAVENLPAYFSGTIMDITEQKEDDQRKNDFISMVSHELKTPLTSMNAYIQILTKKSLQNNDSFTEGILEKVTRQSKKMTMLINGFLNMKRLESGKIHIDKRPFNLAELVKEIEEEAVSTNSSHQIEFAPSEEIVVDGDQDKIGQVITNLISNAVKYSKIGTTIHVDCVTVNNEAQISVRDQGMGISKQDQPRLFDRFYRVENQDTETINGFGIGLYLCDEIVKRHNGRLWVESELGEGSAFFVTLPLD